MEITEAVPARLGPDHHAGRRIRPATGGPEIRCGLVDLSLAAITTSVVFFYPSRLDYATLHAGLVQAIEAVPAFAGRLQDRDDSLWIMPGEGLRFSHASSPETMSGAVARTTRTASGLVDHVDSLGARLQDLPLFTAQLTDLADGSSALGISWHHAVGDLYSVARLLQAWSAATEGRPLPGAVLLHDRDAELQPMLPATECRRPGFRLPAGPADQAAIESAIRRAPLVNRTVQLYFTESELATMRASLAERAERPLSGNDALCGHLIDAIWSAAEDDQPRRLVVPVNVRPRLDLPEGLIGNVLSEILLELPAHSSAATIGAALYEGRRNLIERHFSLPANQQYLARIGRAALERCVPIGFDPLHRTVALSNWSRFGLYELSLAGIAPAVFCPAATAQIAWAGWLVEGFGGRGRLCTIAVPARLASALRSGDGQDRLHRYRDGSEQLPELAGQLPKLA